MSTQLLSTPRKIHDLSDDLESHFFVILYNALHFVEHDEPSDLDMKHIFDQSTICRKTGAHRGGGGKKNMYDEGFHVVFTSKPFTVLILALFELFATLKDYHTAKARGKNPAPALIKKLKDCTEIERLFAEASNSTEWPTECDKVEDQYPPIGNLTSEQKDTVALSFFARDLTTESSTGKRKRNVLTGPQSRRLNKRSKLSDY